MEVISVLLPTYNAARYVNAAVASVLGQSHDAIEVLALDDGSTDGTAEILDDWARRDARLRVIRLEHGGIVSALNRGLAEARGEFIARMDGDDIALPQRFEAQLSALGSKGDVVAVGGAALAVDPRNRPIAEFRPPTEHMAIVEQLRKGRGSALIHPTLMARTSALRAVGAYRESYRHIEDLDLFWRLGQLGRLSNIRDVVLRYRQHRASANLRHAELQAERTREWLRDVVHDGNRSVDLPNRFYRPSSTAQLYADWSAKAMAAGYLRTSMIYAFQSLLRNPRKVSVWRVLGGSLRRSIQSSVKARPS